MRAVRGPCTSRPPGTDRRVQILSLSVSRSKKWRASPSVRCNTRTATPPQTACGGQAYHDGFNFRQTGDGLFFAVARRFWSQSSRLAASTTAGDDTGRLATGVLASPAALGGRLCGGRDRGCFPRSPGRIPVSLRRPAGPALGLRSELCPGGAVVPARGRGLASTGAPDS